MIQLVISFFSSGGLNDISKLLLLIPEWGILGRVVESLFAVGDKDKNIFFLQAKHQICRFLRKNIGSPSQHREAKHQHGHDADVAVGAPCIILHHPASSCIPGG